MFNLTRQERTMVAFLTATALLGLGIRHYKLATISKQFKGYKARTSQRSLDRRDVLSTDEIIENKGRIDVNSAGFGELVRLPGVGPKLAARIIEYRENHGPFSSAEQIMNVKGIGPKKFEKMREFLRAK